MLSPEAPGKPFAALSPEGWQATPQGEAVVGSLPESVLNAWASAPQSGPAPEPTRDSVAAHLAAAQEGIGVDAGEPSSSGFTLVGDYVLQDVPFKEAVGALAQYASWAAPFVAPDGRELQVRLVPLDASGRRTSLGSIAHAGRGSDCTPCRLFHSSAGCPDGVLCEFCHFPHNRKSRVRPCKGKRERYRKLLKRMEAMQGGAQSSTDRLDLFAGRDDGA